MTKRKLPDPNDPDIKRAHERFKAAAARGEISEDSMIWRFAVALWRYEHGEPEMARALAACIIYGAVECPPGLRTVMGAIATGERRPGRKLGKCTAGQGMMAAMELGDVLNAEDKIRANAGAKVDASRGAAMAAGHVTRIASGAGIVVRFKGAKEPGDIIAESLARVEAAKERIAAQAGISVVTLEKLERDLRAFLLRGGV